MKETTRRNLFKFVAAGGLSAAMGVASKTKTEAQSHGHHRPISGVLAQATVSFGAWASNLNPAVDRLPVPNPGGSSNIHQLVPDDVKIQAGGVVNFIIAGFHQVVIYDNGTQPEDINANSALPAPLAALIDDPNRRIYRGLTPAAIPANFFAPGVPATEIAAPPQDRVESVLFPNPGSYLVICGVRNHFVNGNMFGYVRVLP
jgi:hypothetical protein